MNVAAILDLIAKIASAAPVLKADYDAAKPILSGLADAIKGKTPTDADFAALHARIDALTADIEAAIP